MRRDDSSVVEPGVKGSMTGRYAYGGWWLVDGLMKTATEGASFLDVFKVSVCYIMLQTDRWKIKTVDFSRFVRLN